MYSEDQFVMFNHSVQHHVSNSNSVIDVWIISTFVQVFMMSQCGAHMNMTYLLKIAI